jgi:hypothetical protein
MIIVSYVYCCLVLFIRFPPKRVEIYQIFINLRFSLNISDFLAISRNCWMMWARRCDYLHRFKGGYLVDFLNLEPRIEEKPGVAWSHV